jgi:hypothetical protein
MTTSAGARLTKEELAQLRRNRQDELDRAAIYQALGDRETVPSIAKSLFTMAEVERTHAAFWAFHMREADVHDPVPGVSTRARLTRWLATRFGRRALAMSGFHACRYRPG